MTLNELRDWHLQQSVDAYANGNKELSDWHMKAVKCLEYAIADWDENAS